MELNNHTKSGYDDNENNCVGHILQKMIRDQSVHGSKTKSSTKLKRPIVKLSHSKYDSTNLLTVKRGLMCNFLPCICLNTDLYLKASRYF